MAKTADHVKLTVIEVTGVEIMERSQRGEWNLPDSRGVFGSTQIPWTVLWMCNDNAIRPKLTPGEAEKFVTASAFRGLSTYGFSSEEAPPERGNGPVWMKIPPMLGDFKVKANTLTMLSVNDNLVGDVVTVSDGTNDVLYDIDINDIESVEWLEQAESAELEYTESVNGAQPSTVNAGLAELRKGAVSGAVEYYFDDMSAVYPTFSPAPDGGIAFNQARIEVRLSRNVTAGKYANIYFAWFDPKLPTSANTSSENYQCDSDKAGTWLLNGYPRAAMPNQLMDNHSALKIVGAAFDGVKNEYSAKIHGGRNSYMILSEFVQKSFGDSFMVAVETVTDRIRKYRLVGLGFGNATQVYNELYDHYSFTEEDESNFGVAPRRMTRIIYLAAWNGFKVPKGWGYNQKTDSIETETLAVINAKNPVVGETYCKSVLELDQGFELTFSYEFLRDRGYNSGYVQPNLKRANGDWRKKISFISNSGVKFGGIAGADTIFELSLFDVYAMVQQVPCSDPVTENKKLTNFKNAITIGTEDRNKDNAIVSGIATSLAPEASKDKNFEEEWLSQLMHGIKYKLAMGEYKKINGFNAATPTLAQCKTLFQENYDKFKAKSGTMKLDWTLTAGNTGTLKVYLVSGNASTLYFEDAEVSIPDKHIYIQSHWGSGVRFSNVQVKLK